MYWGLHKSGVNQLHLENATVLTYATILILENVEHCGGQPEQADTACPPAKLKLMGARRRLLCPVSACPLVLGCQGKACLSTCCLSHGEVPGEGMSVDCGYIHMHELSFYTRILS